MKIGTLVLLAMLAWVAVASAQRYVAQPDTLHPRLKFADSLISLNDRCAVAKNKLNPRVRPVYVNGKAVGFC